MFEEVTDQIDAVHRRLTTRPREGEETKVVTISQTYDADIDDVWSACTDPERIPRWFLPVSGDLRLGGRYQLEGNAGGEILECEPPRRFAVTWEFGGGMTWLEVRLGEASAGRTTLELEHAAHVDEHWTEFGPGAVGVGWDLGLLGLRHHLSGGAAIDPQEALTWQGSAEAKEFMALSSEAWCRANIEAGTDEADARAAAARTTAAYTGAEPAEPAT
jgi:uncharacterized protein YndB with AHSA1/START domain